jgi:hypothetical protein
MGYTTTPFGDGRIAAACASLGGGDRAIRSNLLAPLFAPPKVFPLLSLARGKPLRGLPLGVSRSETPKGMRTQGADGTVYCIQKGTLLYKYYVQ